MKQTKILLLFFLSFLITYANPILTIEQTPSGITLNIAEENGNETLYELSLEAIEKGYSQHMIAKVLGISQPAVYGVVKRSGQ